MRSCSRSLGDTASAAAFRAASARAGLGSTIRLRPSTPARAMSRGFGA